MFNLVETLLFLGFSLLACFGPLLAADSFVSKQFQTDIKASVLSTQLQTKPFVTAKIILDLDRWIFGQGLVKWKLVLFSFVYFWLINLFLNGGYQLQLSGLASSSKHIYLVPMAVVVGPIGLYMSIRFSLFLLRSVTAKVGLWSVIWRILVDILFAGFSTLPLVVCLAFIALFTDGFAMFLQFLTVGIGALWAAQYWMVMVLFGVVGNQDLAGNPIIMYFQSIWIGGIVFSLILWSTLPSFVLFRSRERLNSAFALMTYILPFDEKPLRALGLLFILVSGAVTSCCIIFFFMISLLF